MIFLNGDKIKIAEFARDNLHNLVIASFSRVTGDVKEKIELYLFL